MNPILSISGTECKECRGTGEFGVLIECVFCHQMKRVPKSVDVCSDCWEKETNLMQDYSYRDCNTCQGKGKSPNIKIFKYDKSFEKLPKKGDVIEIDCSMCYGEGYHPDPAYIYHDITCLKCFGRKTSKFHLTSDAVVKTAQEVDNQFKHDLDKFRYQDWEYKCIKLTIQELDKLVWLEGYDE